MLWNRTDKDPERLHDFYVFVSDTPFGEAHLAEVLTDPEVWRHHEPGPAGRTTVVPVHRPGRHVRIQLAHPAPGILALGEVQVFPPSRQRTARTRRRSDLMTMQPWFTDAKLGIFIHWGIYAVDGTAESWAFYDGDVPYDQYKKQLDGFTAARFDADAWAALIARSGAGYAVLTAKHHDGVALWDTQANDLSTAKATPAARDLVAEYTTALRAYDLKVGLHYSHIDWSHPDYASLRHYDPTREWIRSCARRSWPSPRRRS